MEHFAQQFPAVTALLLAIACAGLLWYLRIDRAQLFARIDRLGEAIEELRKELHHVVADYHSRLLSLEKLVDYHIRHNGRGAS